MLVAFTRCCCQKEKDEEDGESGVSSTATKSGTLNMLRSLKRKSKRRSSGRDNSAALPGKELPTETSQVSLFHITKQLDVAG